MEDALHIYWDLAKLIQDGDVCSYWRISVQSYTQYGKLVENQWSQGSSSVDWNKTNAMEN